MLLSIVTGTANRLPLLQRMVASVRSTVPDTLAYEFVIVDGSSTDGTIEWCEQQPDITLIRHDGLYGAIKAFNDGGLAARGDYLIFANDDISFHPGAILRALAHLEDNPTCGMVAFADNRRADFKLELGGGYGVQRIFAEPQMLVYGQVAMFRRWLGLIVGLWGIDDPVMKDAHTYGGDAYLSARIWELGYSVDAVRGVTVQDYIHRDELRQRNTDIEVQRPPAYYRRFPNGPKRPDKPLIPPRDESRLRVLYLPIYEPGAHYAVQKQQKHGLRDAFAKRGLVWEVDYIAEHAAGTLDLIGKVDAWKPDVLFLQLHSTEEINAAVLAEARKRCPHMLVILWNGDVWTRHLLAPGMIDLLRHVDLHTCVNGSALKKYDELGINAHYWQCGWEPVDETELPDTPHFDAVFTGNCYSDERKRFGEFLYSLANINIGIYGAGWPKSDGQSTYNFTYSRSLYANSTLILGDNQFPEEYGFVSNRVFDTLAAGGGLLLHQHVPGMAEYTGITAGEHFIEWTDLDDLRGKIAYWLDPKRKKERRKIANAARRFMEDCHSFDSRLDELFDVILPEMV